MKGTKKTSSREELKKLTIEQILSPFGEKPIDKNLHVFLQKESIKYLPVDYPFRLDHFTIILIKQGQAEMRLNLINYILKKNDLLVILPDTIEEFIAVSDDLILNVVSFSATILAALEMQYTHIDSFNFLSSQYPGNISISPHERSTLKVLMLLLEQKNSLPENHPFKAEIILSCFKLFLYEVSAIYKINASNVNYYSRREMLFHEFTKLLHQHIPENKTLKFYAEMMSITPNYLTKLTKLSTGKTAGNLINEMLVLHSKLLLHQMTLSIAEVSQLLFFSDQFIFSRFFRKNTGLSPTAYRKKRM